MEEPSIHEIGNCLPPLALIPRLPNTAAGHVAREFGAKGPCHTSGGQYPAGMDAMMQGARWIATGECRRVIVLRIEAAGVMAAVLAGECEPGRGREILSWEEGRARRENVVKGTVELETVHDWDNWPEVAVYQSGWKQEPASIVLGGTRA